VTERGFPHRCTAVFPAVEAVVVAEAVSAGSCNERVRKSRVRRISSRRGAGNRLAVGLLTGDEVTAAAVTRRSGAAVAPRVRCLDKKRR
jgi:hypothetical protein